MSDFMSPQYGNTGQNPSPWFTIANQFLPRNLHDVIRWSRYITTQSPTTTEVIRKMASYPITDFKVSGDNVDVKKTYKNTFKLLKLRQTLQEIGFAYYTVGNVFISVYFPIIRTLTCQRCNTSYNAKETSGFIQFKKFIFSGTCPHCNQMGEFTRTDTKSTNVADMNIIRWDPLNISVNNNPITGQSEYYYTIPNDVKRRILTGDMLYLSSTPWSFIEAVQRGQDYKFDVNGIYHMKVPSLTTVDLNGIAVPPLISLFGLIFYQATLRKANESIATEFLNPLRVVYPMPSGSTDPAVNMSLGNFKYRMEDAIKKHKRDRNHVLVSPVPIGYSTVSGEGRALLVNQEIQQAEDTMLLSLGVSRELLSGTTNWTSSTVGLRLMESTMDGYVGHLNELLSWLFGRISSYLGLEKEEVTLEPFKLIDDTTMQQMFANLASQGKVSMSAFYETVGMDYEEELERTKQENIHRAVMEVETDIEVRKARITAAMKASTKQGKGDSSEYSEFVKQCLLEFREFVGKDPAEVQLALSQLEVEDPAKALVISELLRSIQAAAEPAEDPSQGSGQPPKAEKASNGSE